MAKTLSKSMIDMYVDMVNQDLQPLIELAQNRVTSPVLREIEIQVKKDFGVYALYEEKAALQLRLREIDNKLTDYEGSQWCKGKVAEEVQKRQEILNTPMEEIRRVQREITRKIKLTGVATDVSDAFSELPKEIKRLETKIKKLKPITPDYIRQLSQPKAS